MINEAELTGYFDNELSPERRTFVEAAIAQDPKLAQQLEALTEANNVLSKHAHKLIDSLPRRQEFAVDSLSPLTLGALLGLLAAFKLMVLVIPSGIATLVQCIAIGVLLSLVLPRFYRELELDQ